MNKLLIILILVSIPCTVYGMSDEDYARYRRDNAERIYQTDKFTKSQIRRMQRNHDKAVTRHYRSTERAKDRRHQLEMQLLRNNRHYVPKRIPKRY